MTDLYQQLAQELTQLAAEGRQRSLVPVRHLPEGRIRVGERSYLNLAGNDYLGLAANPALLVAFYARQQAATLGEDFAQGSTASRLMTGNTIPYTRLEQRLAALYQNESALVFNSGYHINIGILPTLASKQDLILADKLCHASLIDAFRLSRARTIRYPHLDYAAIEQILARERAKYRRVFLVTESIFSMDGDTADLAELVRLKERWQSTLYVDEAHAVGLRGPSGCGLAEEQGLLAEIDLLIGTFGKAFGGQGAFVVGKTVLMDYLINNARSLIFTTGLPPVTLSWLDFVLTRIPAMQAERAKVAELSERLRRELQAVGLTTCGASNIVPVIIGDAARAVAAAKAISAQGYWVKAVRPPTVPEGTSRLRLSLSAAMNWQQLAALPGLIAATLRSLSLHGADVH